jgi:hypothetical protein
LDYWSLSLVIAEHDALPPVSVQTTVIEALTLSSGTTI